ncbi:hypothetical protein V7S43_006629 [Phytophthora oleae]|uniref:Pectate lyase n=1 Tax=Phytophthora oleae TaxID=2107226 RepID=A0ABD3FS77_9STRA
MVAFAQQVLVLVCFMTRQVDIFCCTWKIKRDGAFDEDKTVTVQTMNAREGSEAISSLGGEPQYYGNNSKSWGGSMAGTASNANDNYDNRLLHGQQPQNSNHMQCTHTVVRNNEVDM